MKNGQLKISLAFILILVTNSIFSQHSQYWDKERIRGEQYISKDLYRGSEFLFPKFIDGKITFISDEELTDVKLKFNAYKNELVIFNDNLKHQVEIDKETVKAFELYTQGKKLHFEKKYYKSFIEKGNKYMELLYDGSTKLYCYRVIELQSVSPYFDSFGRLKDMEYSTDDKFFLIGSDLEFYPVRLKKKSLFNYLNKDDQRKAKKIFRQNQIYFKSETGFIKAIELLEKEGISFLI